MKTTKTKIMSALKGLDYADQMKVLNEVKRALTIIDHRKESIKDWGKIHRTLILES